jgi:homoserine dehydrogenase
VLSPTISCIKQNKVSEVRGILNGTTNFILTEMFTYGKSFDDALADAKARGYAEADPSADILGTDACRKIAILTALVTGKLVPTENIHTEGITAIRKADVLFAQSRGCTVKLVARCMVENGMPLALVAPFLVPQGMPLSGVNGVYNAVEVIADPLGDVMFYGQGAGAGATASAVVGDLCQVLSTGRSYTSPVFEKCTDAAEFSGFTCRHYLALNECDADKARSLFTEAEQMSDGTYAVVTSPISEGALAQLLAESGIQPVSDIRLI